MLSRRRKSSDAASDSKGALGLNTSYSSSEPLIDYVFVHGLGGGSRKTWSESADPGSFWPKEWLSKDPAFKNARVHSLDIMQIGLTEKKTFSTFMILADRCWTVFETPHRYDMMKKYVLEVSLVHSVVDPLTEPSCICWTQHGRTCDKAGIVIHLGCSLFCPFICLLRHICLRSEIRHVHRLQSGSMQWFSWGHRIEARILRRF